MRRYTLGAAAVFALIFGTVALMHALPWLLAQRPGLPTLLSVWTLTSMYLAGSNPRRGWTLALLGQVPWAWYTYDSQAYGFVWLNVGLTVVYVRNLWLAAVLAKGRELFPEGAKSDAEELIRLRAFVDAAFEAHPNLDLDVQRVSKQPA